MYSANGIASTSPRSIVRRTIQLFVNYRWNTMLTCAQLYLDNTDFLSIFESLCDKCSDRCGCSFVVRGNVKVRL